MPPLLAGTLQCTRDEIEGGDFYVSLKGIPDYRIHGYKSKLKLDINESNFVTVPYRFNQIMCFLGNLPHGSTEIDKIHGSQKRTIVGFNVCCMISGPVVMQAPEHSSKFRRKVQVEKLLSRNMTLNRIKNNKPLAKLLVLAKRKKIKMTLGEPKKNWVRRFQAFFHAEYRISWIDSVQRQHLNGQSRLQIYRSTYIIK